MAGLLAHGATSLEGDERVRLAFPECFAPYCVTAIDGHHEEVDDS